MSAQRIVVFDLETGGLLENDPVIQLAAIAVNSEWSELESYEAKINFNEEDADTEALKINHYDRDVWASQGKSRGSVVSEFSAFLLRHKCIEMVSKRTGSPYSVALLAGYNAATFDGPRLQRFFAGAFLPAHPRVLCVMQRVLWLAQEDPSFKPVSFQLTNVAKALGVTTDGAHDSLCDVRTTVEVMKAIRRVPTAAA